MVDKFDGFGPVYVINLRSRLDRKKYIKDHFKKYKIKNYKFVIAVDGRKSQREIDELIHPESFTDDLRSTEIAVALSHLKAIKSWLETSDSAYAIFCEDDVDLSTSDFWDFTWNDFFKKINVDYDIIQMNITNPKKIYLHPRKKYKEYSAGCYLITRPHAEKLMRKHFVDGKYKIVGERKEIVADELIYNSDKAYSVALFTYKILQSNVNPDKESGSHQRSIEEVTSHWKKHSSIPIFGIQ